MAELTTSTFDLPGLLSGEYYCAECAERVCARVSRLPGVVGSTCDVEAGALVVEFDPELLPPAELAKGVQLAAEEVTHDVGHAAYRLEGLD